MSGHPRRDHGSSRDRHRERDRDRSCDRGNDRDRYSHRESDRYRRTDSLRRRSRERERDTDQGRERSHRPKSLSRSPRQRSREHSREHLSKEERAKERYMRTFARGGRIFEDNGGLPSLQQQGIEDRWAGFSEPSATRQYDAAAEHQQQYAHHGMTDQYQDAYSAYGANLEAGLEGDISAPAQPAASRSYSYKYGDEEEEEYDFRAAAWSDEDKSDWAEQTGRSGHRRRRGWRDEPSATLYVRGVPDEAEEADFHAVLSGFAGVRHVRVTKDRSTGRSKGYAFVDFDSIEAATAMMESEAAEHLQLMGQCLQFEYSVSPQPAHADGSSEQSLLDWICSMCQAVNFSRRLECYQCSTVRAADVKRVNAGPEGPSSVLKVSGIDPHTTEDVLHSLIAQHVPVREIRLVRDKYTGEPRGFCFVQFHSVAHAGRALQLLQNAPVEGQANTLRLCYAKERAPASGPAADALQAAAAMSAYTDWAPKQFDESALEPVSAAAPADASHAGDAQPDTSVAATQQTAGFVYDPASGYYHDPSSGYYYDANTGLYFVSESQQWLGLDPNTGQFYDPAQQPAEHVADPAQVPAGLPSLAEGQTHAQQQQSLGDLHAPEATYEIKKAPAKKKGAVIGSAPKLNSEGLLAAARAAQEKEERQKAQEAKQKAKSAAAPAAAANRQQQSHPQMQARQQPQMPPESQGLPGMPTPQGPVRGVIRSSGRWNKQS